MRHKPITVGDRFGRLIVKGSAESKFDSRGQAVRRWLMLCDCGVEKIVAHSNLRNGSTMSCGCVSRRHDSVVVGARFERWTVLREAPPALVGSRKRKISCWVVRCDCGTERTVHANSLVVGGTRSCGCLRAELSRSRTKHGGAHADAVSHEYASWMGAKGRCFNKSNPKYPSYGGRGITVCERWLGEQGFANFLTDMGRRPGLDYSLDRFPDNDGNYEPGNCRWATRKEQARNRRDSRRLSVEGVCLTIAEWAEKLEVPVGKIHARLNRGWSADRALGIVVSVWSVSEPEEER